MLEVLNAHMDEINNSKVLEDMKLEPHKYIVVSSHREENIDIEKNFNKLMPAINAIAEKYQMLVIFSTHPRTKKRIDANGFKMHPLVRNVKPLGFLEYVKLQKEAFICLSDSGTLTEESAMLHFPAVLIRTSTERPEGVEAGSIIVSGITEEEIKLSIDSELMRYKFAKTPENYDKPHVSRTVVDIIKKYIDIVNKEIWLK